MTKTPTDHNSETAVRASGYYDKVWPALGTNLDYTDVNRIGFITREIERHTSARNLTILDYGCGRGWMAPFLSRYGSVTGVDFSDVGINFARTNYGSHGTFLVADPALPNLGVIGGPFDTVVCSEVIEHAPDAGLMLRQINGLLKPGGWLMLTTPNGNVWPQFQVIPRYAAGLQPVENWLTVDQLRGLLRAQGLEIKVHEGRPVYEFRIGLSGLLQRRKIERLASLVGLEKHYYRAIRSTALYQMVAAKRPETGT